MLTIDGTLDLVVVKCDRLDSVIGTSTNRADRQPMSTRADRVLDRDVRARVDGHAVILVVDIGARDDDVGAIANVESVCVLAKGVARLVVDGHVGDGQAVGVVDRHGLNGRVVNVQVRDGRVCEVVRVEELGLGHAARAALAVPPVLAVAVEVGARGAFNGDAGAFDLEERAVPLGIFP